MFDFKFGDLLTRHTRDIEERLYNHDCVVYEVNGEVTTVAGNGSIRRYDIIVIDKSKNKRSILDPTVRLEIRSEQPTVKT